MRYLPERGPRELMGSSAWNSVDSSSSRGSHLVIFRFRLPAGYALVINRTTAKDLNLKVPPGL